MDAMFFVDGRGDVGWVREGLRWRDGKLCRCLGFEACLMKNPVGVPPFIGGFLPPTHGIHRLDFSLVSSLIHNRFRKFHCR
jgi:hypothetical protein